MSKTNLTPEDLASILASYNEATEKLRASHDGLQQEVRRLHNELGRKNRQLERRKRLAALGEMAAGLAHEIRNPLGGIMLYADLLRKDLTERQDLVEVVDKIICGVQSLDGLVGQVLAMTHTVEPKLYRADLSAAVSAAVELLDDQVRRHKTQVSLHLPERLEVICDREMIHRAVLNLVRNAIQAAGPSGQVTVDLSVNDHLAIIQIADDGDGIDPKISDRIFNPFFTTKDDGTGLGLTIVHRIVEAHEGSITVGPSRIGGTTFTIRLPISGKETQPEDRGSDDGNDSSN